MLVAWKEPMSAGIPCFESAGNRLEVPIWMERGVGGRLTGGGGAAVLAVHSVEGRSGSVSGGGPERGPIDGNGMGLSGGSSGCRIFRSNT